MTRRSAVLLASSPIADDPRVRRMGDSLAAAGWDVTAIGLPGSRTPPPSWPIHEVEISSPRHSQDVFARFDRAAARLLSRSLAPLQSALRGEDTALGARLAQARGQLVTRDRPFGSLAGTIARGAGRAVAMIGAQPDDRRLDRFWRLNPVLGQMRKVAATVREPALWIANDWWMLPIAAEQARRGGAYVYDSHELATEEYAEKPSWVQLQKPVIEFVERRYITDAAVVSSVSPGITEHLRRRYALTQPTLTVRNTPHYSATPFRPTGTSIRVLYHGVVSPGRGLEAAIDSAMSWRPEWSLHIRGPASDAAFLDGLKARAAARGVGGRVSFLPPVPMTDLVAAASEFDVGLMALPAHSLHNVHALPNKLFEYLMAGLALAVTDLPEMARLVRDTGAGVLLKEADAGSIAEALNRLTASEIDAMRRSALRSARALSWEQESREVLAAYEALASAHPPDADDSAGSAP